MTIYIDLGTKVTINIAIQTYLEYAFNKKEINKEVIMNTIEGIFGSEDLQKYWIEKKFPQKKKIDPKKIKIYCKDPKCFNHYLANHKLKEAKE